MSMETVGSLLFCACGEKMPSPGIMDLGEGNIAYVRYHGCRCGRGYENHDEQWVNVDDLPPPKKEQH